MVRPCGARGFVDPGDAVLHQCIRLLIGAWCSEPSWISAPGPLHVFGMADQLELAQDQRQAVRQLFESMKAEAVPLGEKLIEEEIALDRAFAERSISSTTLTALTAEIGETQGRLRAVHLKYHLTTADLLTAHQAMLRARPTASTIGCSANGYIDSPRAHDLLVVLLHRLDYLHHVEVDILHSPQAEACLLNIVDRIAVKGRT